MGLEERRLCVLCVCERECVRERRRDEIKTGEEKGDWLLFFRDMVRVYVCLCVCVNK